MKKLLKPLLMLTWLGLTACSEAKDLPEIDKPEIPKPEQPEIPESPAPHLLNIGSYIRPAFFETGQIDTQSLNSCQDLIFFTAEPLPDGTLHYETPHSPLHMHQATHHTELDGRQGVMVFHGNGSMKTENALLVKAPRKDKSGQLDTFTFGTWIRISQWNEAVIFSKDIDPQHRFSLQLGATAGQLIFSIGQQSVKSQTTILADGKWHHLCLTHQAHRKTIFYLDGKSVSEHSTTLGALPYSQLSLTLAEGLEGALDETFFHSLVLPPKEVQNVLQKGLNFKNWTHTKALAYWKYDQASQPGMDDHSWLTILKAVRSQLDSGSRSLRLGIHHGYWQQTCQAKNRDRFVEEVAKALEEQTFDGVDLDFEWPTTATEYADYSATIVALKKRLGNQYQLSVSLHPTAFKLHPEAIQAADWISLQCYGPRPARFPFSVFVQDVQAALEYGIPAEKLVAGLPFYATQGQGASSTIAYRNLVENQLITNPDTDEVSFNGKKYTFNGQSTIHKKVQHAKDLKLRGIMSWDLATDCALANPWSLQRTVLESAHL